MDRSKVVHFKMLHSKVAKGAAVFAAALLFAGASSVQADKLFGGSDSVPQWGLEAAKIPSPDSAKGAASVLLLDEYIESVDEQGHAIEREHTVYRILQPQARGQGCSITYDEGEKIKNFREWTITPDGHSIQAKDADFRQVGDQSASVMLATAKRSIVHPPAADVGSVIVCDSEQTLANWKQEKVWQFQYRFPVVHEALELDLPAGMKHFEAWRNYAAVKPTEVAPNHWRWEMKDVPGFDLRQVHSRPDTDALIGRMNVIWGAMAADNKEAQWRAIGDWYGKLEEHRSDPTPELIAKAQALVAGKTGFFDKLDAISQYIQKNVRYFVVERGIGGYQTHPVADVFRTHSGDCKDKAALWMTMLKAVGMDADFVMVDSSRGVVDRDAPSLYGDHMIAAVEVPADVKDDRLQAVAKLSSGQRVLFFDPTNEHTPVGNLPYYLQGGTGLFVKTGQSQAIALPVLPPAASGTEQKGSFTLSAEGELKGTVDTSHSGPEGGDFRDFLKYTDEKERREYWEKLVARDLQGLTLTSFRFVQPESLQKPLEFHYAVTVPHYSHQAGPLVLVRNRAVGELALPFEEKLRMVPIDLNQTGRWHDVFEIQIPDGYVVDELPDPVKVDEEFASYNSSVTASGNVLHYEREYVVRQVQIPSAMALVFRVLEGAILADEAGTTVLKKK